MSFLAHIGKQTGISSDFFIAAPAGRERCGPVVEERVRNGGVVDLVVFDAHAPTLRQPCRPGRMRRSWMMVVKKYRQFVSNYGIDGNRCLEK
jgi:hypothetical protein